MSTRCALLLTQCVIVLGVSLTIGPPPAAISSLTDQGDTIALIITGAPDTVFRTSTSACESNDRPDVYAHAVRTSRGVMLLSGNAYGNYVLIGPDLDHLHRDCKYPRLISASNLSPQSFQNREWIVAAYRVGRTIHALIHNEYHDPSSPLCKPGDNGSGNPCWYNAVTYAYSVDDGMTFQHPRSAGCMVTSARAGSFGDGTDTFTPPWLRSITPTVRVEPASSAHRIFQTQQAGEPGTERNTGTHSSILTLRTCKRLFALVQP